MEKTDKTRSRLGLVIVIAGSLLLAAVVVILLLFALRLLQQSF